MKNGSSLRKTAPSKTRQALSKNANCKDVPSTQHEEDFSDLFVGIPGVFCMKDFITELSKFICGTERVDQLLTILIDVKLEQECGLNAPFTGNTSSLRSSYTVNAVTSHKDFTLVLRRNILSDNIVKAIQYLIKLSKWHDQFEKAGQSNETYSPHEFIGALQEKFKKLSEANICTEKTITYVDPDDNTEKPYYSYFPEKKKSAARYVYELYRGLYSIAATLNEKKRQIRITNQKEDYKHFHLELFDCLYKTIHIGLAYFVYHGNTGPDFYNKFNMNFIEASHNHVNLEINDHLFANIRSHLNNYAKNAGIDDIEKDIDLSLFCPIYDPGEKIIIDNLFDRISQEPMNTLIIAEGGHGKTYRLIYTAKKLLEQKQLCIYIPGYAHNSLWLKQDRPFLIKLCALVLNLPDIPNDELFTLLNTQKTPVVILLDGFNESANCDALAIEINEFLLLAPAVRFVITSRTDAPVFSKRFAHLTMLGLGHPAIENYLIKNRIKTDLNKLNPRLLDLLSFPFYLNIYKGLKKVRKNVDTEAELIDSARQNIINKATTNDPQNSALIETVLSEIFPSFALSEYNREPDYHFAFTRLEDFINTRVDDINNQHFIISFLKKYQIILYDNQAQICSYRHEYLRDYWVAFSIHNTINKELSQNHICPNAQIIIDLFSNSYSSTILGYFSQLSWNNEKDNSLVKCIESLRSKHFDDIRLWESDTVAAVTSKLIQVLLSQTNNRLIGFSFDNLNLTLTDLSDVVTCTTKIRSSFTQSLITDETFLKSTHEGAPRRAERIIIGKNDLLITISDFDILIHKIENDAISYSWHLFHNTASDNHIHIKAILSSSSLGPVILAIDKLGHIFRWHIIKEPFRITCKEYDGQYAVQILTDKTACKAVKYLHYNKEAVAVFCNDGTIVPLFYSEEKDRLQKAKSIKLSPSFQQTKCYCYSFQQNAFYWAATFDKTVYLYQFFLHTDAPELLCTIDTEACDADLLECIPHPYQDDNAESLILSCTSSEETKLYQIDPVTGTVHLLHWAKNQLSLQRSNGNAYFIPHRINSIEYINTDYGGEMILSSNTGCLYRYIFNTEQQIYEPAKDCFEMLIKGTRFPIEHALYLNENRIAALSIDRNIYIKDSSTNYSLQTHKGINRGIRKLLLYNSQIFAFSYDSCLLEFQRPGNSLTCVNKVHLGTWCWSAVIVGNIIIAGYIGGIKMYDIKKKIVYNHTEHLPGYKVETLFYDNKENILYSAENTDESSNIKSSGERESRVTCYLLTINESAKKEEDKYILSRSGIIPQTKGLRCYGIAATDNSLYFCCNKNDNGSPEIIITERSKIRAVNALSEPKTAISDNQLINRYREVQVFSHFMIAGGPIKQKSTDSSSVQHTDGTFIINIWDIKDEKKPVLLHQLTSYSNSILRVKVHEAQKSQLWRIAAIDTHPQNGEPWMLYKFEAQLNTSDSLTFTDQKPVLFDNFLCDVEFTHDGNLSISDLKGNIHFNGWTEATYITEFANYGPLTFGSSLSNLYRPISPDSILGKALLSLNNTIDDPATEEMEDS